MQNILLEHVEHAKLNSLIKIMLTEKVIFTLALSSTAKTIQQAKGQRKQIPMALRQGLNF